MRKVALVTLILPVVGVCGPTEGEVDYRRAEQLLTWNTNKLVANDLVEPHWIDDTTFWYRNSRVGGHVFKLVNVSDNMVGSLFDHSRLANALTKVTRDNYSPESLPLEAIEINGGNRSIAFRIDHVRYSCNINTYECRRAGEERPRTHIVSPNEKWEAYIEDFNVFVRHVATGKIRQLTEDGSKYFRYGSQPYWKADLNEEPYKPQLMWSQDSTKIAVQRNDEREVGQFHLVLSTFIRPKLVSYPNALPGEDAIPQPHVYVLDVQKLSATEIALPSDTALVGVDGRNDPLFQWSEDSRQLYFTVATRGHKERRLIQADVRNGTSRILINDRSTTYVDQLPWRVTEDAIFWVSERDNWAHIYQYDHKGRLIAQVTEGQWPVADIVSVDDDSSRVIFTARGRESKDEPYYQALYRVSLEDRSIELLTPEPGSHRVHLSPTGKYFTDTYSTLETPPVTVLRDIGGRLVRRLETADISALSAIGWRTPERFTVTARDGETVLYGALYKPTDFDPTKKYPLIDHIYPGPTLTVTPHTFFPTKAPGLSYARLGQVQALAELGFVVMHIDAMGTRLRSKSFHDTWHGNFADNGLPDHVAAIKQLSQRYPFIDADRVGIYGISGGGFASTSAILRYPETFKVAVSMAGNHDNRSFKHWWGEKYNDLLKRDADRPDWDSYQAQANYLLADKLEGQLLLMHGTWDDNVHPSLTLRLVDALVEADKDFDMYMLPQFPHGFSQNSFAMRKTWDYFVEHLLGKKPPSPYHIETPTRFPWMK